MNYDTFDEGVAPGGLRSKQEIKVLICYLFNNVKDKLSETVVTDAISEYGLANFFEVKIAFDELTRSGNFEKSEIVDGEQTYVLTENGKMVADQLEGTIALTVKEKALRCAIELLAERKTLRENFVDIKKTDKGYELICRISGGEVDLMTFTLYAPDYEQAEIMQKSFLSYPAAVYKTMLALMTQNREIAGEALEDVYNIHSSLD